MGRLRALFAVSTDDPDLARSQLQELARQLPLLYAIVIVNEVAVAWTHVATAPLLLSIGFPGVLCAACLNRAAFWLKQDVSRLDDAQVAQHMRTVARLAPGLGLAFTAWALCLASHDDLAARGQLCFFIAFTLNGCVVCLQYLRGASFSISATVLVPYCAYCFATGDFVVRAITVNLLLVSAIMLVLVQRNHEDFARMVRSRREVLARQAEAQRLAEENNRLANLDMLTGLPNRRRFLASLNFALEQARDEHRHFAVALLDLDGFKGVNDVHGHTAGDRLLVEVGRRLSAHASETVMFARLGGDEFGAILSGNPSAADMLAFGDMVCALLRQPYNLGDVTADLSGSVGLVAYPEGGDTAPQLFERSDYALYHAKQTRRGQPVIFSHQHETMIRDAGRLEQALRHADLDAEMWLAFQPLVDAQTGRTIAFEALARWTSPVLGKVGPDLFIPVAERAGMVGRLTSVLLVKALAAAASWPPQVRISFNLSAQDVASPDMVNRICDIIRAGGVDPARIDLEITETAVMRDFKQADAALAAFRAMGISLSLDDFGTGYSSLSHVHRLKPEKIKIDRSFVLAIHDSRSACDIVRTILDLCRNLGTACVVEGVETEAQRSTLGALGCRIMQGYLFGRPMSQEQVAEYLAEERTRPLLTMVG